MRERRKRFPAQVYAALVPGGWQGMEGHLRDEQQTYQPAASRRIVSVLGVPCRGRDPCTRTRRLFDRTKQPLASVAPLPYALEVKELRAELPAYAAIHGHVLKTCGAARQDLPASSLVGDWCDGRISMPPGATATTPSPSRSRAKERAMAPASTTARWCSARLGALRCTGPGLCRARSRPSRSPKTVALSSRSPRRPMGGMAPARARTCQRDRFLRRDRRRAETLGAGSFASHRTVRSWRLPASTAHPRRR